MVEEKVSIILRILKCEISIRAASLEVGVGRETIRRWMARYEAEGAAGFLPREQNRVYSPKTKRQAVEDYLAKRGSLLEISKKYKLRNDRQLHDWIKVYNAHGDFNSVKFSRGGSCMKQGRETTQEERVQIARECIASSTLFETFGSEEARAAAYEERSRRVTYANALGFAEQLWRAAPQREYVVLFLPENPNVGHEAVCIYQQLSPYSAIPVPDRLLR